MFSYWLLFGAYAFGATQHARRAGAQYRVGPIFLFVALATFLMIAFRYKSGADWDTYQNIFDYVRDLRLGDVLRYGDPGYSLVNWVAGQLGLGFWCVNFICAIFFTWGLMRFARAQPNPWLAVSVAVPYLIIVVGMGYTRQGVAIGFILAGLAEFNSKKLIRFAIYIFFAATFHKTAVVILPIVALAAARDRILGGIALLAIAYFLYSTFLSSSVDILVTNYIDQGYDSSGAGIRVAMNLVPATIFLLWRKRFSMEADQKKVWILFSITSFVMLALLAISPSSTAVDRLSLYLLPLQVIVLSRVPDAFAVEGDRNPQLVLLVIFYSAIVQFTWFTFAVFSRFWIPYQIYPLL